MSRSLDRALLAVLLGTACLGVSAAGFTGLGRPATAAEIKAWDIDVRPDFKGLPPGSGSVRGGETIWIEKCSSCHGDFGDANTVFTPLIGGTTVDDIKTGHVASLRQTGQVRSTMTRVPTVSTLWDFINRAMPWDKPKSLKPDEVYAVLAYLLNLADIVPTDFVLTEKNIAWVQARMPNRNGMTRDHGMWDIHGKPDTHNTACMKNCRDKVVISSSLPDSARAANGELQQQNREYGAIRGTRTTPEPAPVASAAPKASTAAAASMPPDAFKQNGCLACHGFTEKIVGPAYADVAAKYKGQADAAVQLREHIKQGGSGRWGPVPMPPQSNLSDQDLKAIVDWLLDGAKK